MNLSNELISQFVKVTNDDSHTASESTVYGTTVEHDGKIYVRIDGSDRLTPVSTTADMKPDERVNVIIKNHTATVTGNYTSPSARTDDVHEIGNKITEVEILVADRVTTKQLEAEIARIDTLTADNVTIKETLTATEADIGELRADNVNITEKLTAAEADIDDLSANKLDAEVADIKFATIDSLKAVDAKIYNLDATYATIDKLEAVDAKFESLNAEYADIEFANITEAAVKKIFADYGVIEEFVASDGTITKQLVAVEINGDLIKAGTIQVDRLIVKGSDGNYYAVGTDFDSLEGVTPIEEDTIHGSILVAKSVTADKVTVTDLMAFGATIAGFVIEDLEDQNVSAIHSIGKNSIDSVVPGTYLDNSGQVSIGDGDKYIRFYKDGESTRLEVSADSVKFRSGNNVTSVQDAINTAVDGKATTAELNDVYGYVDSELEQQNANLTSSINNVSATANATDSSLSDFKKTFDKYITFNEDDTAIKITAQDVMSGNIIELELDAVNGIQFKRNGSTVFGKWVPTENGTDFYTGNIVVELNQRAQFGNFAFLPRPDGSLSLMKVGQ